MAQPDAIRAQAAYDRLPVELRRLLADAPVKVSAEFVLAYYQAHGLQETMWRVKAGIEEVLNVMQGNPPP